MYFFFFFEVALCLFKHPITANVLSYVLILTFTCNKLVTFLFNFFFSILYWYSFCSILFKNYKLFIPLYFELGIGTLHKILCTFQTKQRRFELRNWSVKSRNSTRENGRKLKSNKNTNELLSIIPLTTGGGGGVTWD